MGAKNQNVRNTIPSESPLRAAADRATDVLRTVLGEWSNALDTDKLKFEAEWSLASDGRGVTLALTGWTGTAAATFAPAELQPEAKEQLFRRLNDLWGELLQMGSHHLLVKLNGLFAESGVEILP